MGDPEKTEERSWLSPRFDRSKILNAIQTPLSFFALCLLIVELSLAIVVASGNVFGDMLAFTLVSMVCIFFIVLVVVYSLVWFKPESLVFDPAAHISRAVALITEKMELNRFVEELVRDGRHYYTHNNWDEAERCFVEAISIDPACDEARNGLALTKSRQNPLDLRIPIEILSEIVVANPLYAKASYNLACLKARDPKKRHSKREWLSDLQRAISGRPRYRGLAKNEKDFSEYFDDNDFQKVVITG